MPVRKRLSRVRIHVCACLHMHMHMSACMHMLYAHVYHVLVWSCAPRFAVLARTGPLISYVVSA